MFVRNVAYCGVVCDELERDGEESGAKMLVFVVWSTGGKEGELACK